MAVDLTPRRVAVAMIMNMGTDEQGKIKTSSVSLGSLNAVSNFDAQKAKNIVNAFVQNEIFSKTVYSTELTQVSIMEG